MRKFNSTRLFYRKYPYKLHWYSPLAHFFRGGDLETIRDTLDRLHFQYGNEKRILLKTWNRDILVSTQELHEAQKVFNAISKNSSKVRVEGRGLQIYSEHRDWLYNLAVQINANEWWEPENILQPNTIVMGPSMRGWGYRITLGTHVSDEFSKWALNNLDKLKLGSVFKKNILNSGKSPYLYGMYFYVKNEKMLNLATLVLGRGISRIDKIIIEDNKA